MMMDKRKPKSTSDAAAKAVSLISDDERELIDTKSHLAAFDHLSSILSDSDSDSDSASDSDIKVEEILRTVGSAFKPSASKKLSQSSSPSRPRNKPDVSSPSINELLLAPQKGPKRGIKRLATSGASSALSTLPANRSDELKPFTLPSATQSSMTASLVFDMVTSLSTSDPGVAIATLRSIVALGKEYPSDLLYAELIDRIQSHEAVAYNDAVAIYAALVFVFDKALTCSCAVTFPNKWEPLATALQEVSGNIGEDGKSKKNESWRRNLLVVQFFVYCFQQDMHTCRLRYERLEQGTWVHRTRLFSLLQSDAVASSSAKARAKSRATSTKLRDNKLIFLAIGWGLQLWKCVFDDEDKTMKKDNSAENRETSLFLQQEGEQACLAVVRLIEMLYLCTDQQINTLQRIQAGLAELMRPTRIKFAQALQSPVLRTQLASTMIGLSNKSRSKETEWYECNALGRVQLAMNPGTTSDVAHTDGYSWSHFDSFINLKPKSNLTKLLQEISRMQHY